MKTKGIFLSVFFMTLLILVTQVFAQFPGTYGWGWWEAGVKDLWVNVFGLSEEWLGFPAFIYNFIIPFIAIFAVALGILRELRIFRRQPNIEVVLAFVMAFATLPTRWFVAFVGITLAYMGGFSYVVFLALFTVGIVLFFWGRVGTFRMEHKVQATILSEIDRYRDTLEDIRRREERTELDYRQGIIKDRAEFDRRMADLERRRAEIWAKLTEAQTRMAAGRR